MNLIVLVIEFTFMIHLLIAYRKKEGRIHRARRRVGNEEAAIFRWRAGARTSAPDAAPGTGPSAFSKSHGLENKEVNLPLK
ncbi:unnamed protein product [Hermetia illucens]|uniref:Uncharacterized protein n=1 Tax=Hermetia illucens TaxID=343691 RepID=A0A7R8V659_HERIL|nr:unnamed protein product [Hermetia illucens]